MSIKVNEQKIVSLDCSTVGGPNNQHILARVTIVDFHGKVILDTFVSPETGVRDFRFKNSGVKQQNLIGAPSFSAVQKRVHDIIVDKIVVGDNLQFHFLILGLSKSIKLARDIRTNGFILETYGHTSQEAVSLKKLSKLILQRDIQIVCNDSIENAIALMDIYKYFQCEIETGHLKDMQAKREEPNRYPQRQTGMESESSNGIRNAFIAGGIVAGGILAVAFSIFANKNNNK